MATRSHFRRSRSWATPGRGARSWRWARATSASRRRRARASSACSRRAPRLRRSAPPPLRPASLRRTLRPASSPPTAQLCLNPSFIPSERFHLCSAIPSQGFHKVEVDGLGQPATKMPSPVRWSTAFLDPSLRISREADGTVSVYSKARVRYAALPCMWRAYAYNEEDGTPLTPPPCSLRWSRQTRRLPSRGLPRRRWSLRKWRRKSKTPGRCGIGLTTGGARPRLGVTPTSPEHCGDPDRVIAWGKQVRGLRGIRPSQTSEIFTPEAEGRSGRAFSLQGAGLQYAMHNVQFSSLFNPKVSKNLSHLTAYGFIAVKV